jgi:hypothetical protein
MNFEGLDVTLLSVAPPHATGGKAPKNLTQSRKGAKVKTVKGGGNAWYSNRKVSDEAWNSRASAKPMARQAAKACRAVLSAIVFRSNGTKEEEFAQAEEHKDRKNLRTAAFSVHCSQLRPV